MRSFRTWIRRWITHGSGRTVVLLPGIVVKIGIHPFLAIRTTYRLVRFIMGIRHSPKIRTAQFWGGYVLFEIRKHIRGILENRREHRLSRTQFREVIAPTYVSLFGIITIAERVPTIPFGDEITIAYIHDIHGAVGTLWKRVHPERELSEMSSDLHHSFSEGNFGLRDGRIVLLDYGAEAFEELMARAPEETIRILRDTQP